MSRCDDCGGEDCVCCELFVEQQADILYGQQYDDDDANPFFYFNSEDEEDEWEDE